MTGFINSVFGLLVTLAILITVHEFGHYWVARRLGVRVLRFSIGFGKALWRSQKSPDDTEFVVAILPLGGYVKMLDEREGEVPPQQLHQAFNRQSLATRTAVVMAGPLCNFLFAILAYWLMFVTGIAGILPVVGEVRPGSYAEAAGLQAGDRLLQINGREIPSWEEALMRLLDLALDPREVDVNVQSQAGATRKLKLDLGGATGLLDEGDLLHHLGLKPERTPLPAVLGELPASGAASRHGLQTGDRILSLDGEKISSWRQWAEMVQARPGANVRVIVERDGEQLEFAVTLAREPTESGEVGRIGAWPAALPREENPLYTVVRYGPVDAVLAATTKTAEVSALIIRTLWSMIRGEASAKNLSGPISIAQFAGHSASIGLAAFLGFLGLLSVSLGVLNLLPVPMLDGGHLMYYLIEFLKGSPVSESVQMIGQQVGIVLLVMLMGLAFYNDLARVLG